MTNYRAEYEKWLDCPALSENEWKELHDICDDDKEIESRFFAPLEFGTAGLRGTMKLGLHHMNVHVIRHATQAFADVVSAEGETAKQKGVVIAFDCRMNSDTFAREAACVMAGNGIHVSIFESLRPTPELRPEDRVRLAPGPPRSPGSCPRLPAVDDNGRVQRALMQVVGVHLLDEAQQVAGAVRQASAGGMGVSEPELVRASSAW